MLCHTASLIGMIRGLTGKGPREVRCGIPPVLRAR